MAAFRLKPEVIGYTSLKEANDPQQPLASIHSDWLQAANSRCLNKRKFLRWPHKPIEFYLP
jgi:hypothetical protein